jgi:hypothetical protein
MALGDRQRPISLVRRDPPVVEAPPALEPELPPDRERSPDPTARVGSPEEFETRLEMRQRLAIPGGLDEGDPGPALPVRADRRGRRPTGLVVEGDCLREKCERFGVGVVLECLTPRSAQVVDGLLRRAGPAPVMSEERDERLDVGNVRLVPLGHGPVKRTALGVDEQVVGDLLGDHVGEQVGEVRVGRLETGQVEPGRMVELLRH